MVLVRVRLKLEVRVEIKCDYKVRVRVKVSIRLQRTAYCGKAQQAARLCPADVAGVERHGRRPGVEAEREVRQPQRPVRVRAADAPASNVALADTPPGVQRALRVSYALLAGHDQRHSFTSGLAGLDGVFIYIT